MHVAAQLAVLTVVGLTRVSHTWMHVDKLAKPAATWQTLITLAPGEQLVRICIQVMRVTVGNTIRIHQALLWVSVQVRLINLHKNVGCVAVVGLFRMHQEVKEPKQAIAAAIAVVKAVLAEVA